MNIDMVKSKPPRIILDTNILISAHVFGGKPEQVYNLVLEKQVTSFISPVLIVELTETLSKKFSFDNFRLEQLGGIIEKHFKIIHPHKTIHAVEDDDDNRVLEAAVEGGCSFIITGDKDLLVLGTFRGIKILTAGQFLSALIKVEEKDL